MILNNENSLLLTDINTQIRHNKLCKEKIFFRIEEDNGCAFIGKVDLVILESPNYEATKTVRLCDGLTTLTAPNTSDTYLWNLGMTEQEIENMEIFTYEAIVF